MVASSVILLVFFLTLLVLSVQEGKNLFDTLSNCIQWVRTSWTYCSRKKSHFWDLGSIPHFKNGPCPNPTELNYHAFNVFIVKGWMQIPIF